MIRWFVAHTQARAEGRAKQHLEQQGFAVYLPRYLKQRRHARRIERVPAPLFPRYLFVGFDPAAARWRAVQSTVGISHLIRQGDRPIPIPDAVLQSLRAAEDAAGFFPVDQRPKFSVGESIRIVAGAFTDTIGRFHSMTADERVVVLLDFLGREIETRLPVEAVAAA